MLSCENLFSNLNHILYSIVNLKYISIVYKTSKVKCKCMKLLHFNTHFSLGTGMQGLTTMRASYTLDVNN